MGKCIKDKASSTAFLSSKTLIVLESVMHNDS